MTAAKVRQPVPRVPPMKSVSRNTAHLPGEFPFTEMPKSGPVENRPENDHKEKKMSTVTKLKTIYNENKSTIKRKVLVGLGAAVGMAIATGVAEYVKRPSPAGAVIIIAESDLEDGTYDTIEDIADVSIN